MDDDLQYIISELEEAINLSPDVPEDDPQYEAWALVELAKEDLERYMNGEPIHANDVEVEDE
jgi:hypothetical protein